MNKHQLQLISPEPVLASWNVSRTFLWRLEKAGLLEPLYLNSRKLYRLSDVQRLETMIENGELRSALRGAAAQQKKTKGGRP